MAATRRSSVRTLVQIARSPCARSVGDGARRAESSTLLAQADVALTATPTRPLSWATAYRRGRLIEVDEGHILCVAKQTLWLSRGGLSDPGWGRV